MRDLPQILRPGDVASRIWPLPAKRITVNLAPADLPKEGGRFDLPIALGILMASGQVPAPPELEASEFYGELALTGELKPVPGLLLAALHATEAGHLMVGPAVQAAELHLVEGARLRLLRHLAEIAPAGPEAAKEVALIRDVDGVDGPARVCARSRAGVGV